MSELRLTEADSSMRRHPNDDAPNLLDTDILSFLMRQRSPVVRRATNYLRSHPKFVFSIITRYEILRGLKAKSTQKRVDAFDNLCRANDILDLTNSVVDRAASIYADLHRQGRLIGDADILIAATALEFGLHLATNNTAHFSRIPGLVIDNWAPPGP